MSHVALAETLRRHGQDHLWQFADQLSVADRAALERQIAGIDFAQVAELFRHGVTNESHAELAARAAAPPAFRLSGQGNPFTVAEARRAGETALAAGQVGAVLVAGGQGTRLGFDHPKGMYPIGPVSNATLFQILIEKLVATGLRYGVRIPLYLMTSPATHEETLAYLDANQRFGLAAEDLIVFCQGTMPAVDAQSGRLLLEAPGRLFASPDGHGGMLAALDKSQALADMRRRQLRQLFYFQIDNPLVEVCDPVFVGYHMLAGSELSTQVVAKQQATERVGNVVSVDGQVRIIEYSDLPADIAAQQNADGSLKLWAGNIAVHVFDVAFLERVAADDHSLPFHVARKAVPYLNERGELITPSEPNAIKFERFIFDLLPLAKQAIVMEIDGRRVFAPVKNAPGSKTDSPETVRRQMLDLYREWLAAAGANVGAAAVEISPRFALDATELASKIAPGTTFATDTYLTCDHYSPTESPSCCTR
ncbi:MAG: UDPGP type 1 family protein [Planctomycetaceae bacterium]|nr:UDPGP type 1 family protein [Planctomycetaceae bacterium]